MTYKELIAKLTECEGPCLRLCSYCPEEFDTAEVKECVEELIRELYKARETNDVLVKENHALSTEATRLTRLCQSLLEKISVCADALEDVANKTYIFRRGTEDGD